MLSAPKNFLAGLRDHFRAHRLVFRQGLWKVILIPGLLSLVYFPAVLVLTGYFFSHFGEYATENWLPEALRTAFVSFVLTMLLWLLSCFLAFVFYRNIIMILYSPGLGYLSEKVEELFHESREAPRLALLPDDEARRASMIGHHRAEAEQSQRAKETAPPFTWKRAMHSMRRGILVSLVTLALSLATLALCYLLILIPFIGAFVSLFVLPLSQMFFAGIGFADPALDRRNSSVASTLAYSFRNRWRLAGHGAGFILLLMVPVLGWFLAPSYGIIAGTLGAAEGHHDPSKKLTGSNAHTLPDKNA